MPKRERSSRSRSPNPKSDLTDFLDGLGITGKDASILELEDMTMRDLDIMAHYQSHAELIDSFKFEKMDIQSAEKLATALVKRKEMGLSRTSSRSSPRDRSPSRRSMSRSR